jgi:hypothetical protein
MAQSIAQLVSAIAASDGCAIVSMRSPKPTFREILNDFSNSTENNFQQLETNNCTRLVIVIDRQVTAIDVGTGVAKLERRS